MPAPAPAASLIVFVRVGVKLFLVLELFRIGFDLVQFLIQLGRLVEHDTTERIFHAPADPRTEAYVTGKVG